jgi:transcriptional regulator of aromatic amino acid metabolism
MGHYSKERCFATRYSEDSRQRPHRRRNVKRMVEDGEFRGALYYRVHVFPLMLLPCANDVKTSPY